MPFVPVPETLLVEPIYLWNGQRVENTMYFQRDRGWDFSNISDLVTAITTLIETDLLPLLSSTISLLEVVARVLDTATSLGFSVTATPGNAGGVGGGSAPNNASYAISFRTGITGRSFRGRNYVLGMPDDARSGNTVDSDFRTGVLAFYSALRALASEQGCTMVVVSRFSGVNPTTGKPVPRVTGITTPIESFGTFDTTIDAQRRRLPGRGR